MGNSQWSVVPSSNWREYLQWFLRRRQRFVVRENSMAPTLMPGDTVLAEMGTVVQIGDIAILRWSDVSGSEPLSLTSGRLLVKRVSDIFYDGGVYVISDNLDESSARDSRHFGVIPSTQVLGRVTSRLAMGR